MKRQLQFSQYLIIGLALLISVTGDKVTLANRTQGVRRVWEIKATWSSADIPASSDQITTNTGKTVVMKVPGSGRGPNFTLNDPNIAGFVSMEKSHFSSFIAYKDTRNTGESDYTGSQDFTSGFALYLHDNKIPALPGTGTFASGSAPDDVILNIKKTLRYLERLPGH